MNFFVRATLLWIIVAFVGDTMIGPLIAIRGIGPDFSIIALVILALATGPIGEQYFFDSPPRRQSLSPSQYVGAVGRRPVEFRLVNHPSQLPAFSHRLGARQMIELLDSVFDLCQLRRSHRTMQAHHRDRANQSDDDQHDR